MVEQHEWIKEDRKFFGQPNTHYDFKATDPQEAGQRIQKLEATKDKLSKNVNMRAMNMLGKASLSFIILSFLHFAVLKEGHLPLLMSRKSFLKP